MTARGARFVVIGAAGFLMQLATLSWLISRAGWSWLPATLAAVELAVVHNFLWHARWTWRDRLGAWRPRFVKFQIAAGATALFGNAALMLLLVGRFGWPPVIANTAAVVVLSAINYASADRWIFRAGGRRFAFAVCAAGALLPAAADAQTPETLAAWDRYVSATEARLERSSALRDLPPAGAALIAAGESLHVPSGTITDWRGSVVLPGITLNRLVDLLMHPGTPPPQEDVAAARVLARTDDSLRVSIRFVRRAIVAVTYDTEHEMRFRRVSARLATARTVATRIEEVGGTDHGFLWRLHSYWRYEEVACGVRVELELLTLSRDVPYVVRPIAAPLMARIARESVVRTLEAMRRSYTR